MTTGHRTKLISGVLYEKKRTKMGKKACKDDIIPELKGAVVQCAKCGALVRKKEQVCKPISLKNK